MIKLRKNNINTGKYWDNVFETEIERGSTRIAIDRFDTTIELIEDGSSILDIGCGRGEFIEYLLTKKSNCSVIGVDFSTVAITEAKHKVDNVNFIVGDISTGKGFENITKVDVVTSFEVIEHLTDPMSMIKQVEKHLKQHGYFVLTLPFENMVDGGDEHINSFGFSDVMSLFSKQWDILTMSRYYRNFSNLFVLARFNG